jgi:ABC-type multidrug transport system permease subunit
MFKNVTLAEQSVVGATQNGLLAQAVGELSSLPRTIVSAFQSNVDKQVFSALGFDTMAEYLNQTIWSAIINVASFLILFVVAFFLVTLLVNLLNNVFHFPVLKHFDWLLGGAFGLVRGIVIVSLILAVVPLITSMLNVQVIQDTLNASALMGYFPSDFAIADIIARSFA